MGFSSAFAYANPDAASSPASGASQHVSMKGDALRRDDIDATQQVITDALVIWHRWADSGRPVDGYPTECPSCRMSKAARRQESQYEDAENDHTSTIAQAVDNIIARIHEPYRTALAIDARNHATGHHVWVSARLPEGRMERAEVVAIARDLFAASWGQIGMM